MKSVETELEHVHIDPAFVPETKDVSMADATNDEPSTSTSPAITTKLRILAKPVSPVRGNDHFLLYDIIRRTYPILSL